MDVGVCLSATRTNESCHDTILNALITQFLNRMNKAYSEEFSCVRTFLIRREVLLSKGLQIDLRQATCHVWRRNVELLMLIVQRNFWSLEKINHFSPL